MLNDKQPKFPYTCIGSHDKSNPLSPTFIRHSAAWGGESKEDGIFTKEIGGRKMVHKD